MKIISTIARAILVVVLSCSALRAQPTVTKDISGLSQLDGTLLPSAAGWTQVTSTGSASLTDGALLLAGGTNQQYTFSVSPSTTPSFEPAGDYTIEFRLKVQASTGRGFDMVLRDKVGRYSIAMGTTSVVNQASSNALLTSVEGTVYHTYRFAVSRASRTAYLYVDGIYRTSVTGTSNTNCDLQLGKGENAAVTTVSLDYVSYDLSGAYGYDTYTIDFESNGGMTVAQQTLGKNLFLPRFASPTRTGYDFAGWYKDPGLTMPWDFALDKVNANTTLYAKWETTLPVALIHFNAKAEKEGVSFNWNTGAEINSNRFEIEHTLNGNDFSTVAVQAAQGKAASYAAVHRNPAYGINYYRMVQYDNNGDKKEYPIQTVQYLLAAAKQLIIYPNPVRDNAHIRLNGYQGDARFELVNMAGQTLLTNKQRIDGSGLATISLPTLPKGIYTLSVIGTGLRESKALIIE